MYVPYYYKRKDYRGYLKSQMNERDWRMRQEFNKSLQGYSIVFYTNILLFSRTAIVTLLLKYYKEIILRLQLIVNYRAKRSYEVTRSELEKEQKDVLYKKQNQVKFRDENKKV